jgi:hypothetical protein
VIQPLTNIFSHRFQSDICCVLPSVDNDQLMVQTKDEKIMESIYTLVHMGTVISLDNGINIHNSWFQIPLALYSEMALIQYFPDDQNPEKKVVLQYDFSKRMINWEHSGIDYVTISNDGVVLRDNKSYYLLNNKMELKDINISQIENSSTNQLEYPSFFSQEEIEFTEMSAVVDKFSGQKSLLGVEYLEYRQYIFISYVTLGETRFNNFLLVLDRTGKIALHQKINGEMKGLGRDTFFIFAEKLIFVSNKNTLNVYAL